SHCQSLLRSLLFCGERRECAAGRQATAWRTRYDSRRSPDAAQRAALAAWCAADPGSSCHRVCRIPALRSSAKSAAPRPGHDIQFALVEAEQLEQRRQVAELLARGRRGAADEVEYPAVLQPVIGEPLHLAVFVEIDRNHPLVDEPLVHEGDRTLGALRNVIEHFAVEGCDRGWRSHHDQHLILARPDRDLLERAGRKDIALLKLFAGASAQRRA